MSSVPGKDAAQRPGKDGFGKLAPEASQDIWPSVIWAIGVFRKHWIWLLGSVALCFCAALFFSKWTTKIYQASAMIEFDPDVVRPLGDKADESRFWGAFIDNREYYETQYTLITSNRVLHVVVRDLSLTTDPLFWGKKIDKPASVEDAAALLRSKIRVEPQKGSRLVTIHVEDADPSQARKMCEAVAKAYVTQNLDKQVSATSDAVMWLSSQLDHFHSELVANETQLHEFKKINDLPSSTPDEVSKMIRLEMQSYDEALTRTRTRKQELQARQSELTKVSQATLDELPASELLSNPFLSSLRKNYQEGLREKRELIAEGRSENHPLVKKVDEKISQSAKDLLNEVRNIQGAIKRDLAILNKQEVGEAALYEDAKKHAVELNLKELEYHRIDRARLENEKIYNLLLEQMKQADLARMMNVNNVRVVDQPVEPKWPIRPKTMNNLLIGLAFGLLIGVTLVFVRELLDSSIKTPADVENELGTPFLGLLPRILDDEKKFSGSPGQKNSPRRMVSQILTPELVVHEKPSSGIAEAARTVRTNLMFMNPDKPHRILLVTSAAPSEGKTTVACSIAISLAQGGLKVCLVDCDLRRPRLHRIFNRAGDKGVTNVLVGDVNINDVTQPTVVENLYSIPSGAIPPNPADILHSQKFEDFIRNLASRFDRIVIDAPPVAAVTDSAIISKQVEGVLFVVRAFSTTRHLAKQGLRALKDVGAPVVGTILNAVDLQKQHNYYQYYYYKKEGYGPTSSSSPSQASQI